MSAHPFAPGREPGRCARCGCAEAEAVHGGAGRMRHSDDAYSGPGNAMPPWESGGQPSYDEEEADRLAAALRQDLTCPECGGYIGSSCVCKVD